MLGVYLKNNLYIEIKRHYKKISMMMWNIMIDPSIMIFTRQSNLLSRRLISLNLDPSIEQFLGRRERFYCDSLNYIYFENSLLF